MEEKTKIVISVQNLIESTVQSGDLSSGSASPSRAQEGIRGHQAVRKSLTSQLVDGESYSAEMPITWTLERGSLLLEVAGRIDGVLKDASGITIHEIKTTTLPLYEIEHDFNLQHWAQAKCYAYMFCEQYGLEEIAVRLTYFQSDELEEKSFIDLYTIESLAEFFLPRVEEYLDWQELRLDWTEVSRHSASMVDFPYRGYRLGQAEMIRAASEAIRNQNRLFAQAPTGTGKTIATLYPAIKALGHSEISRIFYLTAKTTTRQLAEKALEDMRRNGLHVKSVTITAKEKICFTGTCDCDPQMCEFAANYYGRVKKAIREALESEEYDRLTVEGIARTHKVCPFELSLDLSLWSDVVICDYNYLFDPRVYLKRFFIDSGDYLFLIDEAHNLVDRAREMYSSELTKKSFFRLKQEAKNEAPVLHDKLNLVYKRFLALTKELAPEEQDGEEQREYYRVKRKQPDKLKELLVDFTEYVGSWLSRRPDISFMEELLDVFFECQHFLKILELYDEKYVTCYEKTRADFKIKLLCADPSNLLSAAMDKGKASLLFSATLSPMGYFTSMLGGSDAETLALPSPFPSENLCVYVEDTVSTKFKMRALSYDRIAEIVYATASARCGNYMVFFPSFDYMNEVCYRFMGQYSGFRALYQTPGMSEAARQEFLVAFEEFGETSLVGFAVMGGIFGEGIDLTGDRLSGAIVVGVGLPQIGNERNVLRRYFDEQSGNGFDVSYTYPGINRVLQAAGRVIRTEEDRGVVVLVDERFSYPQYRELLPGDWYPIARASEGCSLPDILSDFWGE